MPENGDNGTEEIAEAAEEIAEEIADVIEDETPAETDVDVTVIEAPEPPPETSYVDVGDLHISGPPEMVERVTQKYLKEHIDHNPHDVAEIPGDVAETGGDILTETGEAITPDPVQELIAETAASETVDNPPSPSDWLFRPLGGRS